MDPKVAKIVRIVLVCVGGALGALSAAGVIDASVWAPIGTAIAAWQIPAAGHEVKK